MTPCMDIRNIAIIAHVDHGKTTLVDGLLKQSKTFRDNESFMSQQLIMDSFDQERERGITILAKNTSVTYKNVKINIIDTPGHSDFGGEVERTLNMTDGVLLLVDAQEGPMPQTKFVLRKALDLNLKVIVVINKIDKKDAQIEKTLQSIYDLFLDLAVHESQLEFPVLYAIGREEKAWTDLPNDYHVTGDLSPIFDAIIKYIPAPSQDINGPFQMLVSTLDWDNYKGKYAIGRVNRGTITTGMKVVLIKADGNPEPAVVETLYVNQGLKRVECSEVSAGDIVSITGIKNASIGDTITDPEHPEALPTIKIEEPTLSMSIGANTSPFFGKEGKYITSRHILERIQRELQTNVAMKFHIAENGQYVISGRGELHLSVFLETLRREGYEMEVGKPEVITKNIDGIEMEPVEELTIDTEAEYLGAIKSEIGRRRGVLISQEDMPSGMTRLGFEITTRGILGLRGTLLTLSKGTAIASSVFLRYEKISGGFQKLRKGVCIASDTGKTASYGLEIAQNKGAVFVGPGTMVYAGMIVGINGRDEDIEINVCKEKQLTNNRSVGEEGIMLTPPLILSLEQSIGFLEDDELLEITPKSLRLRKKILEHTQRYREAKRNN
jgi:GTP-binding protein